MSQTTIIYMRNVAYAFMVLLGLIMFTFACETPDEDYEPNCHNCDDKGNENPVDSSGTHSNDTIYADSTTVIINGNDTVFIHRYFKVLKIDSITNIKLQTIEFETEDPDAKETRDTIRTEKTVETEKQYKTQKWVEPDSLFLNTIDSVFRKIYIDLDITINKPKYIDNSIDTVYVRKTEDVFHRDTITTENIVNQTYETNDPNAPILRDTVSTQTIKEEIVEEVERKFVEPDTLFITTINNIHLTYYITLTITVKEPIYVDDTGEGADKVVYLDLSIFTHLYGQIEKDGTKYLNFYGDRKGAHVKMNDLSDVTYGSSLLTREAAISDAEKHNFSGIDENLYFDHVQSIWIWVFNKETKSFMIEAKNGISWNSTPSAKDRFFDIDYEIKKDGRELWITENGVIYCYVAKYFTN